MPPFAMTGCIPILLQKHIAPGNVLYPLQILEFNVILLESWAELPDKLLQLYEDTKRVPQHYSSMQRYNSKRWAHVKHALASKLAAEVCTVSGRSPSTYREEGDDQ